MVLRQGRDTGICSPLGLPIAQRLLPERVDSGGDRHADGSRRIAQHFRNIKCLAEPIQFSGLMGRREGFSYASLSVDAKQRQSARFCIPFVVGHGVRSPEAAP
jgi:hypothetical protein